MQIDGLAVAIPSLEITNEQLLEFIERFNSDLPALTVKRYQKMVSYLLDHAGAQTRFVRDRTNEEKAVDLVSSALKTALQDANLEKDDLDLLIYCGVGRGFLEPASAYLIANVLGMQCQCFDVLDACMSWTRSMELAYLFLKQHRHQHIAIINAELNFYEHGFPELCRIKSVKQLEYTFPAYTIGEAATATIVSASEQEWTFDFESAPEFVDLCAIPLQGFEDFAVEPSNISLNGINNLYAYGGKMFEIARTRMVQLIRQKVSNIDKPDIWFSHVPSNRIVMEIGDILDVNPEKLYTKVFPKLGNIVSATIPAAMDMALKENRLKRGQEVVLCTASAGMSFAVVQFVF